MSDDFVENLALIENNIKPSESDYVNDLMIKDANKEDSLQISIRGLEKVLRISSLIML